MTNRKIRARIAVGVALTATLTWQIAPALPSIASINLCTDQLALSVADKDQILSLSWLSIDPEESMLAELAKQFPVNYGTTEELLRIDPDIVLAGSFTTVFTQSLLRRLGFEVVTIDPAQSLADVARNLRLVGRAVDQSTRAEGLIEAMYASVEAIERDRPTEPLAVVVVRPGGFTASRPSLADDILSIGGYHNVAVETDLDRWGSLSIETILSLRPSLFLLNEYRASEISLANAFLDHPALRNARMGTPTVRVPTRYWACGLPASLESLQLLPRKNELTASQRLP